MSAARLVLPVRCIRALALPRSQSTLAGRIARPVHSMGTWTDRLKRWQSGEQKDPKKTTPEKESAGESEQTAEESESRVSREETAGAAVKQEEEEAIKKQEEKMNDLQDKYVRALAETENVRQRMTKQVKEAKLFGIQGFSKDILAVADILEKATESVPKAELEEDRNPALLSLFEGLKLTEAELQKVFSKNGLEKIDPVGEVFDPAFHEALFEVPGEEPGTVAVVSAVGYVLHGRTIRPAKVGVVKATEPEKSS